LSSNRFLSGAKFGFNRLLLGQLGVLCSSGLGLSGLNLQLRGEILSTLG